VARGPARCLSAAASSRRISLDFLLELLCLDGELMCARRQLTLLLLQVFLVPDEILLACGNLPLQFRQFDLHLLQRSILPLETVWRA